MPALPEQEAKHFHNERNRVGPAQFRIELEKIAPDALSVSALTEEEREQFRAALIALPTPTQLPT